MALDFPASGNALWSLYDACGIRPEYVLPVLDYESGFNPAAVNSSGYSGINQASAAMLTAYGQVQATYITLAASAQITAVVNPMYEGIVKTYGVLRSGIRCYQANFLPATLNTDKSLSSVLAAKGSSANLGGGLLQSTVYTANANLDADNSGEITVSDLATVIAKAAASSACQTAITQTYALRPSAGPPHDPVYGEDFGGIPWNRVLIAAGAAGVIAWAWHTGFLSELAERAGLSGLRAPRLS